MQIPGTQVQVPALPAPPLLQKLVLEEPLTLTMVFVMAGVVGFWILNRKERARQAIACGVVGVVMAVGIQVLAAAVTTDRERIVQATGELVRATAHVDTAGMTSLLAPEVRLTNDFELTNADVQGAAWNRGAIVEKARLYLKEKYPLKETAVLEVQGVIDREGVGRTQVRVRAVPEGLGFPIISWWRIDWVKRDEAWVVRGIQPVDLGLGGMGR